jgi:hypothetical protein
MATRFRKLRTRKTKHRKALKTRKQRGGIFNEIKNWIAKYKEKKEGERMFEEEQKALERMKEQKERNEQRKANLAFAKKR